jgi:hypothetical protein
MKAEDLNLADADFVIGRYPIGALPTTPTGKLAAGADLLQMQAIDVDEFRDLVNMPDLKRVLTIRAATRKATQKLVSRMLETGQYESPPDILAADPTGYAQKYAAAVYLDGIAEDMDPELLELLANWIDDIKKRIDDNAPPPAPAQTAGTSIAPIQPPPLAPIPAAPPGAEMQAA